MKELDAFFLTNPEKARYIHIHETHFGRVQRDLRSAALHLRFQFLSMLPAHAAISRIVVLRSSEYFSIFKVIFLLS